jgi:small-conductance mechanosensitive channel
MTRVLLALLFLAMAAVGAAAQGGGAPAPAASLSATQARQALEVLKDPAKRAQVIAVLEALAKAAPAAASPPAASSAATAAATPAIPLAPDSLGAQLLVDASTRLSNLSGEVLGTVRAMTHFPLIAASVMEVLTDPWSQTQLLQTGWRLLVVMLAGLAAQWAAKRLLGRPLRSLAACARAARIRHGEPAPEYIGIAEAEAGQTEKLRHRLPASLLALRYLPYVLARLVLSLLPPLAMLAVGYGLLGAGLAADRIPRLVILGVLDAYVLCRVCTSISRALAGPGEPRLLPVSDATGQYILRWVRRIAAVAIFGTTLAEVGLLFGMYQGAHDALLKLVALVVDIFLAVVVLQKRVPIAHWIRARPGATGPIALMRNRMAGVWHIIAIFYLLALWMVWALAVPDGVSRILWLFFVSVAILILGRLLGAVVVAAIDRAIQVPAELAERYPGLESRMGTYHPLLRGLSKAIIGILILVALLQAWGWDALGWFTSGALGQQLLSAFATMGVTLVLALAVWEGVNGAIQRHLAKLAREAQLGRSARLRTLLPMLRTALFIAVAVVAGLMVLSQIGVNIAPLLAGAGVVGLAIGFGSQKLVQDIITGLFLLLENTMQVGDTINLANLTGTVENLSVRTIRLRALDGAVHIIPFSAVTTVTNMSRDFGYAVLDVEAGLNEEPDRIADVLREIARDMRAEPRWQAAIREDIEVMGVDRFIENAWVLRVRIKTTPGQRLAVTRELNRRIKYRFDELAIESPFTSHSALGLAQPPAAPDAPPP